MFSITTTEKSENGYNVIAFHITSSVVFFGNETRDTRDTGITVHYNDEEAYVIVPNVVDGLKAKNKAHAIAAAESIIRLK